MALEEPAVARLESREGWLLQGDAYAGREGLFDRPDTDVDGANVMSRWERRSSPERTFRAQVYFDHVYRRAYQPGRDGAHTAGRHSQGRIVAAPRHPGARRH